MTSTDDKTLTKERNHTHKERSVQVVSGVSSLNSVHSPLMFGKLARLSVASAVSPQLNSERAFWASATRKISRTYRHVHNASAPYLYRYPKFISGRVPFKLSQQRTPTAKWELGGNWVGTGWERGRKGYEPDPCQRFPSGLRPVCWCFAGTPCDVRGPFVFFLPL